MLSAQKEKKQEIETKESFMQKSYPGWKNLIGLKKILVLADKMHFAAFFDNELQICNLKTQECVLKHAATYLITDLALLSAGEIVIAEKSDDVHIIKYNAQTNTLDVLFSFQMNKPSFITAITGLKDGSFAIGHSDNTISIWKYFENKYQETEILYSGIKSINAMDTRQDGSFVISAGKNIFIYNLQNVIAFTFTDANATDLIVFPDDTFVYYDDSKKTLYHMHIAEAKCLGSQEVAAQLYQLTEMPNGWMGCLAEDSLQFFEPSWVRNYIAADTTIKEVVREHLPTALSEMVAEYAGIALFNSPKMPQKRKDILLEDASTRESRSMFPR
jgi:hypothetical protein